MSNQHMKAFIKEVLENPLLRQKIENSEAQETEVYNSKLIKIANEAGYTFTEKDWEDYRTQIANRNNHELSDHDLDHVRGGAFWDLVQCPKMFSETLCIVFLCPNVSKLNVNLNYGFFKTYNFCKLGFWDKRPSEYR